jgi:hypothetical protein
VVEVLHTELADQTVLSVRSSQGLAVVADVASVEVLEQLAKQRLKLRANVARVAVRHHAEENEAEEDQTSIQADSEPV